MKINYASEEIRQTFIYGSFTNVYTVVQYNLYEMPEFVAQQLGAPSTEDVKAWIAWLDERLDRETTSVQQLRLDLGHWVQKAESELP